MLIRQIIDLEYISNTECPKFLEFLNTIFGGNISMIDFIQECIGYSLSGFTTEDCLFFLYGTGKNGKSTFAEILKLLFGNYFHKANIELILQQKNNNIRNDIADLKGKRIVITSEIADGRHLAESLVKDFTGGDYITARRLYQDYFTFKPFFKLWVYGNHKPIIRGTDEGIKRRIKLIPFTVTIPSKEVRSRDSIIAEIIPELPGILNWALKGFNKWRENGSLCFPSEVSMATENYLKEMDRVQNFVNERCNVGVNYQMKVKDLYEGYQNIAMKMVILRLVNVHLVIN
ncbi:MAG: hypothetical protein IPN57_00005 [Ignavibacteria bacterium]|nr:hypothetical protein [Ignavibacteria bacterium]